MLYCCLVRDPASASVPGVLEAVARACSPRVDPYGDDVVVFDASGLRQVLGPPLVIAEEVTRLAATRGVTVRVALAPTTVAAWLLAHACARVSIVEPGEEAAALSALPIACLATLPAPGAERQVFDPRAPSAEPQAPLSLTILERWGIRTLGEFARLPRADLHARFGQAGVRWHQAACGEETTLFVPAGETPRFIERLELEWPIEGLEPLSFVLARLCDALSVTLERADRGAVTLMTRVHLVTRRVHERTLHLPAPMRDARVLRTLILLDLESHPPDAAIDVVDVEVGVTPGRIVQGALFVPALPSPETISTLIARLNALMGESRVGAPVLLDTHDDRQCVMQAFRVTDQRAAASMASMMSARVSWPPLRRFRLPIAARVTVEHGTPVRLLPAARGMPAGRIVMSAGPWRTSGHWWALDRSGWDRDEWDVELAEGGLYRLARDRATGRWEVEGEVD